MNFAAYLAPNWGLMINIEDHWKFWKALINLEGGHAQKMGIKTGWKVVAVNGMQINENSNIELIRKILKEKQPCEISFLESKPLLFLFSCLFCSFKVVKFLQKKKNIGLTIFIF